MILLEVVVVEVTVTRLLRLVVVVVGSVVVVLVVEVMVELKSRCFPHCQWRRAWYRRSRR